jgi:hypothetical protein
VNLLSLSQLVRNQAITANSDFSFTLNSKNVVFDPALNYIAQWPTNSTPGYEAHSANTRELTEARALRRLHIALGHPSDSTLLCTAKTGCIEGISIEHADIKKCNDLLGRCIPCLSGKLTKSRGNFISAPDVDRPGAYLSADLMYTDKDSPVLIIVDHFTKFVHATVLAEKSGKSIASALNSFFNILTENGHTPADGVLRTDREVNLNASAVQTLLASRQMYYSAASPEQHAPSAERQIRTIKERYRTIRSALPYRFPRNWDKELILHICDTLNLVAHAGTTASPTQLMTGKTPKLSDLPSVNFGDLISVHTGNDDTSSPRSQLAICLGRDSLNPKALLYAPINDTLKRVSSSVMFKPHASFDYAISTLGKNTTLPPPQTEGVPGPDQTPTIPNETEGDGSLHGQESEHIPVVHPPLPAESTPIPTWAQRLREANAKKRATARTTSFSESHAYRMTIKEAKLKYQDLAEKAITDELSAMISYNVFTPVKYAKHIIPSSLFIKEKYEGDKLIKLKARLVAGGHRQDSVLLADSYAPTVEQSTITTVLLIAAARNYPLQIWDVKSAYLNAPMKSDIHMRLNKDLTSSLIKLSPDWKSFVRNEQLTVKLEKALYGTKEAAKLWYDQISTALINAGLTRSPVDPCLFSRKHQGKLTIISTHVDDLSVTGDDFEFISQLKLDLESKFQSLSIQTGNRLRYLGMDICVSPNKITLNQLDLIEKLSTAWSNTQFSKEKTVNERNHLIYRSLTMSLLYIATKTRPDLLFNASMLATHCSKPNVEDYKRLSSLIRYLLKTKFYCTVFDRPTLSTLHVFSDASWNSHPDGKGHSGYCIFIGNSTAAIAAKSIKQKIVTPAAAHAELEAMSKCTEKAETIFHVLKFLGINVKVNFHQDNEAVIKTLKMDVLQLKKMKRMLPKLLTLKESLQSMKATVSHCKTKKMIADALTKPLGGEIRDTLTSEILGFNIRKVSEGVLP